MSESMGGIIPECPGDFVGIRIPHRLNEKPGARLSCRPKRPAPAKRRSRSPEITAHDALKSLLTIPLTIV